MIIEGLIEAIKEIEEEIEEAGGNQRIEIIIQDGHILDIIHTIRHRPRKKLKLRHVA